MGGPQIVQISTNASFNGVINNPGTSAELQDPVYPVNPLVLPNSVRLSTLLVLTWSRAWTCLGFKPGRANSLGRHWQGTVHASLRTSGWTSQVPTQ